MKERVVFFENVVCDNCCVRILRQLNVFLPTAIGRDMTEALLGGLEQLQNEKTLK